MENFNDREKSLFNNDYIPVIKVCSRNMGMDLGTYWLNGSSWDENFKHIK
jgi:hypothetical protein